MNKQELIAAIAEQVEMPKAQVGRVVDAFTGQIKTALYEGHEVGLVGFGTFKVSERGARTGRNPKTGEAIKIAASSVPKFVPGKTFKDELNA